MADFGEPIPSLDEVINHKDEAPSERARRRAGTLRTLARLSLGGALLALDVLNDRLQQLEQEPVPALPEPRDLESVLIPAEEWETTRGHEVEHKPRHVLLGFSLAAGSRLSRMGGAILRRGERVLGTTMDLALNPLRTSRVLSPVRGRFERLVERGQAEVTRWRELGRAEEARSRALAQTAMIQLVDSSVDAVAEDPRFQVFIQEVVEEQGMGLVDEAIEEVRERTVTGDYLLERFVRARLGRPPRESLPAPTSIIQELTRHKAKGRRS